MRTTTETVGQRAGDGRKWKKRWRTDRGMLHRVRGYRSRRAVHIVTLQATRVVQCHRIDLVDVCGAAHMRRFWQQHFDDTLALVYVVALTDYR